MVPVAAGGGVLRPGMPEIGPPPDSGGGAEPPDPGFGAVIPGGGPPAQPPLVSPGGGGVPLPGPLDADEEPAPALSGTHGCPAGAEDADVDDEESAPVVDEPSVGGAPEPGPP